MKMQFRNIKNGPLYTLRVVCLAVIITLISQPVFVPISPVSAANVVRTVNVPYLGTQPPPPEFTPAIFWFGKVDPTINYTDVRVYYYDNYVKFVVHVLDRRLWYNPNPTAADLTNWDAVSLYFKLNGNSGSQPDSSTYRLDAQLTYGETNRSRWQAAYRGTGSGWSQVTISFSTVSGYRFESSTEGGINIDQNDRGWTMDYEIPFTSLGLTGKPGQGTIWGLGVVIHDRDDRTGTAIPDQFWPESFQANSPSTWGRMHFGIPTYTPPASSPAGTATVRNGLNGAVVKDGEVGGSTTCSSALWPDIWNNFGNANYAGYTQINIQNQWDLSDWSCFSKYFITFPLTSINSSKPIISATLSMYLFGGSWGGGTPPDSYIQAFTVNEDWNESTLSWNSAPIALENISGTWVHPIPTQEWVLYKWDVSRAVAQAVAEGKPLRLALYSADGDYHTGKYFISSEGQDVGRPTLQIVYGSVNTVSCSSPGVTCNKNIFIPSVRN